MQIERLVTMANEIAAFFAAEPDRNAAAAATASHLRRFWDPRMRRQMLEHYQAGGSGLSDIARAAVKALARDAEKAARTA